MDWLAGSDLRDEHPVQPLWLATLWRPLSLVPSLAELVFFPPELPRPGRKAPAKFRRQLSMAGLNMESRSCLHSHEDFQFPFHM